MEQIPYLSAVIIGMLIGGGLVGVGYVLGQRSSHHIQVRIDPQYERIIRATTVSAPRDSSVGAVPKQPPSVHRPQRRSKLRVLDGEPIVTGGGE